MHLQEVIVVPTIRDFVFPTRRVGGLLNMMTSYALCAFDTRLYFTSPTVGVILSFVYFYLKSEQVELTFFATTGMSVTVRC